MKESNDALLEFDSLMVADDLRYVLDAIADEHSKETTPLEIAAYYMMMFMGIPLEFIVLLLDAADQ